MKQIILVLCLLVSGVGMVSAQETADVQTQEPAAADAPEQLWDAANTAYINGDFRAAAAAYEQLLAQGFVSVKLYYNLANAYFKENRLGKAILFYHRALRLAPGNDDIRYNLSVAEARTKDNIERIPEFFFVGWMRSVRHTMGCAAWTVLSLVLLACALALFLLYLLAPRLSLRKTGFYGTLVAGLLFVCVTWFAAGRGDGRFGRCQEFARQVGDRFVRLARGDGRADCRPSRRVVRGRHRRREERVVGKP